MVVDDLSPDLLREFFNFMTGKEIGSGMSRTVFEHPFDETKVIKVENSRTNFQNVTEWEYWRTFEHHEKVSKWLAPCHSISYNGTYLIQSKASDITKKDLPNLLPRFLTDHKIENFGKIGRQVVCRDYGFLVLDASLKMRKWRE